MPWSEQLPSGKFRALYRDRRGKRHSAGTFTQKRAAEKAATIAEDAARKVGWRDPNAAERTWGSWCEEWWTSRPIEPGTEKRDAPRRDLYLLPRWADIRLGDITRQDVKSWAADLGRTKTKAGTRLSPASVQRIVYMFSASLNAAIDAEILTSNPAYRIKVTKGETSSEHYLTQEDFELVLDQLPTPYDRALASTLVGTGLRWGEAAGLHIERINFARGTLRVAEVWDDSMGEVKAYPKGRKIRTVPIPDWVLEQMQELAAGRARGLLFAKSTGRPPSTSNWRSRVWTVAVTDAGIGHTRVHDLRHTCASWLIQDGWTLAEVGAHLGHTSPQTTQIYAHLLPTDRGRVGRAIPRPRGANVGQPGTSRGIATLTLVPATSAESQGA